MPTIDDSIGDGGEEKYHFNTSLNNSSQPNFLLDEEKADHADMMESSRDDYLNTHSYLNEGQGEENKASPRSPSATGKHQNGEGESKSEENSNIEDHSTDEVDAKVTARRFYKKLFPSFLTKLQQKEAEEEVSVPHHLMAYYHGNYRKAKKRYDVITAWRETFNIDDRLKFKPNFFDIVEEYLQTIIVGRAKNGIDIVICESYKKLDIERFEQLGITPEHFNNFFVFIHEYISIQLNHDVDGVLENGCYILIDATTMDLKGTIKKNAYKYTEINMRTMESIYPTHGKKIFVCNPPPVLKYIWKAFKMVMPKTLADKFVVVNFPSDLEDFVDLDLVPLHLGGSAASNNPKDSQFYREFRAFLDSLPSEEEYMASLNKDGAA